MKYDTKIVVAWFAEHGLSAMPEYRFHAERKWRFDFAFPEWRIEDESFTPYPAVALEVQGGLFTNGRHSRGAALLKEHEKLNEAAAMGWRVLFTTPDNLCMAETIDLIKRALACGG